MKETGQIIKWMEKGLINGPQVERTRVPGKVEICMVQGYMSGQTGEYIKENSLKI